MAFKASTIFEDPIVPLSVASIMSQFVGNYLKMADKQRIQALLETHHQPVMALIHKTKHGAEVYRVYEIQRLISDRELGKELVAV